MRQKGIFLLLIIFLFVFIRAHAEVQLKALTMPQGKKIQLNFNKTDRAPAKAVLAASLSYDKGITRIDLNYEKMEPAILFAGNITTYVLWALSPDGSYENLGELMVDKKEASGSQQFLATRKILSVMLTAEPYSGVLKPSEIILFYNAESGEKEVQMVPFTFREFGQEAAPALDSISLIQYSTDLPVALKQAEKTIDYALKIKADEFNPKAIEDAKKALARAKGLTGDKKMMADTARIAIQFATQAIKEKVKYEQEKAAAEAEARRQAEKAALEQRAAQAETEAQQLARQLEEIKAERASLAKEMEELARQTRALAEERDALAAERDRLASEREQIRQERDELASKLKSALSTVAETTETARGLMVNLAGVLFDLNKATLKPESQLKLAKLAGILMVFPEMKLSIEGHTDSTGSESLNLKLSTERAKSVYEFLLSQGVSPERMKYEGFGSSRPVAPNDTEANRAKNRRVEVIVIK
ncbi:MAG: OmpA family protein [Candidatus Saccharicenans sp.]